MLKDVVKRLLLMLPRNAWGDYVFHLAHFLYCHHRIPRKSSGLFNDFLFFLKTSGELESALRGFVSDKNLVKIYQNGVLGKNLCPRTFATFSTFNQFIGHQLDKPCIIKPAHLSGGIFYNPNWEITPEDMARIKEWFSSNIYFDLSREKNYRHLRPTVLCEELIGEKEAIRDYKFFCYRGQPRIVQVDVGRHTWHKRRLYLADWQAISYRYNKPLADIEPRPAMLDVALKVAETLSANFEFIRIDMFLASDRIFLGEMTSVPENAHGRFESLDSEKHFSQVLFGNI